MSTVFQIRCDTCEVDGPKVRRGSTVTFCQESITGPFDEAYHRAAADAWSEFLSEHEFHELRLNTGP